MLFVSRQWHAVVKGGGDSLWLWQSRLLLGRQSVWELVYLRRQHHVAYFRNLWAEINRLALPNECPFDVPWPGTVYTRVITSSSMTIMATIIY